MIRVTPVPEPANFDARVRQPGLRAIAELVGEPPAAGRRGPRRARVAERREELRPKDFPAYWTEALDDLLVAYRRLCAYLALYIEPGTGDASVDHFVPKSSAWHLVYEWSNYRLACGLMNSRKGTDGELLDPFEIADDWFGLDLVGLQVTAREELDAATACRVNATIDRLRLNDEECRGAREAYLTAYHSGVIRLTYLERRAPFVASELRRQGLLLSGDE